MDPLPLTIGLSLYPSAGLVAFALRFQGRKRGQPESRQLRPRATQSAMAASRESVLEPAAAAGRLRIHAKAGVLRFGFVIVYNPLHFSGILLLPMPETAQGALLTCHGWHSEDAVERSQDSRI
jgi:hypothetical protein